MQTTEMGPICPICAANNVNYRLNRQFGSDAFKCDRCLGMMTASEARKMKQQQDAQDAHSGRTDVTLETGAIRTAKYSGDKPGEFSKRYDLILRNRAGMEALARAYGEGVLKYGRDNWMLGFQESVYIQHAIEHLISYLEGDTSEDHLGHLLWNIFTLCSTREKRPELMDLNGPDPGPDRKAYEELMELKAKSASESSDPVSDLLAHAFDGIAERAQEEERITADGKTAEYVMEMFNQLSGTDQAKIFLQLKALIINAAKE